MTEYSFMIPERDRATIVLSDVPLSRGDHISIDSWMYRITQIEHMLAPAVFESTPYYINQAVRVYVEKL